MVARHLLPGINNGTVYPRYYSFMAWCVAAFAKHHDSRWSGRDLQAAWDRWSGRVEHAWRLCSDQAWHGELRGIVGVLSARATQSTGGRLMLDADEAPRAFEPQYYGASFRQLGLAAYQDGLLRLSSVGKQLAEAFRNVLWQDLSSRGKSALQKLVAGAESLTHDELGALATGFKLRNIPIDEDESLPLRRVLLPAAGHGAAGPTEYEGHARSLGLGLLLEFFSRQPKDEFLQSVASESAISEKSLAGQPLAETVASWNRYLERQYQKVALGAFWHELRFVLRAKEPLSVAPTAIVHRLLELCDASPILRAALGDNPLAKKGVDLLRRTREQRSRQPGTVHLWRLYAEVSQTGDEGPTAIDRLGSAIVLLYGVAERWQQIQAQLSSFQRVLHEHDGAARLVLPWMARELAERSDDSLRDVLTWLIEWCIIAQANRVAFQKLAQGDRFFIKRDGGGYRLADDVPENESQFAFDSNRLKGAVALLQGLELLTEAEQPRPTAAGRQVLNALKKARNLSAVSGVASEWENPDAAEWPAG